MNQSKALNAADAYIVPATKVKEKSIENKSLNYLEKIDNPFNDVLVDLQDCISIETYNFFRNQGLKTLHLPITTNSISSPMGLGSDSKPVEIDLFNQKTYLADSMQFLLEYGTRFKKEGCYYLMPSFRGEENDASHLSQFYHAEAEILGNMEDVRKLVEAYVLFLVRKILADTTLINGIKKYTKSIKHIEDLAKLSEFPVIEMKEVIQRFKGRDDLMVVHKNPDYHTLTRKGEQELIKLFGGIVWLINFEHISVPFYQAFHPQDRKYSLSSDLLFGLGETVGAGQRHTTKEDTLLALNEHQVDPNAYDWYVGMKEHYPLETAGFGMGIERFMAWVLNYYDIRDFQICYRENGVLSIP